MKLRFSTAVCICVFCLAANPAIASEFYRYTENNYDMIFGPAPYDTSMRVTATLELSSVLPPNLVNADVIPISFDFDDGVNTITENSDIEEQRWCSDQAHTSQLICIGKCGIN